MFFPSKRALMPSRRRLLAPIAVLIGLALSALLADLAAAQGVATIEGEVTTSGATPLPGITIDLFAAQADGSRGVYLRSASTDDAGRYSFDLATADCHVVVVIGPDGDRFRNGKRWDERPVCFANGSTTASLSSTVVSNVANIEGTVGFDDGNPAPGTVVDLFDAQADGSRGRYLRSTSADNAGNYTFDLVDSGCRVIVVIAGSDATFTNGTGWDQQQLCVPAGQTTVTASSTLATDPDPDPDPDLGPEENLDLILSNATRNTQFDNNAFRDVPADQIDVSDLTVNGDIYDEGLLDTSNSGYFRVKCEVSHFSYDDPIVFPDEPGRAHLHMYFGNTEAHAYSDFDSLLNSGTGTCNGEDLNRTAYWMPALLDSDGNALIPYEIMVYYKNDNFRLNGANELVTPFPDGLRMIAGNPGATSPQDQVTGGPGSFPVISFICGPAYSSDHLRQDLLPDCSGNGNSLELKVAFPQCFNEAAGTYQPDQSHMSYSVHGYYGARCPDSHSTDVSSIMYRVFYSPADYGGSFTNLHLSSDVKHDHILPGGTTLHADWFGAWHPEALAMWTENCNNTQADCEIGLLDRDPAISLVKRKRNFYPDGYRAPAEELIKLCPGKQFDSANPLMSVANCQMMTH